MGFKINGDINARNMQIGDNNLMTVIHEGEEELLREKDWEELKKFLNIRLADLAGNENSFALAKKGLDYAERRDEKGLKGFLARNKESFFCNVMSDIASSGLVLLLSRLSF
ncbi:MAG: hypothetical protein HFI04_15020 [Lachnospiraceae bacterium]|jgi:hypothetical protein|nr:hypothetical protein C807_02236 [Lachnospiraceae bacterium 28-4]MCI8847643.1 hypothetical protein [Lachnospiraceae bacterium]